MKKRPTRMGTSSFRTQSTPTTVSTSPTELAPVGRQHTSGENTRLSSIWTKTLKEAKSSSRIQAANTPSQGSSRSAAVLLASAPGQTVFTVSKSSPEANVAPCLFGTRREKRKKISRSKMLVRFSKDSILALHQTQILTVLKKCPLKKLNSEKNEKKRLEILKSK